MKQQLFEYLNRYVTFESTEIDLIYSHLEERMFPSKSFLLEEGTTCRFKYFIIKGVVRSYYIDERGKEKITQFAIDNWWVTNMESFVLQIPSSQYIQAIEDTLVLCISKNDLEKLYRKCPKLERVFRLITERMLIASLRKNDVFLQMKSKERYYDFVKKLPDFVQRVPQYMIASYLEISPEYLSSLRRTN